MLGTPDDGMVGAFVHRSEEVGLFAPDCNDPNWDMKRWEINRNCSGSYRHLSQNSLTL